MSALHTYIQTHTHKQPPPPRTHTHYTCTQTHAHTNSDVQIHLNVQTVLQTDSMKWFYFERWELCPSGKRIFVNHPTDWPSRLDLQHLTDENVTPVLFSKEFVSKRHGKYCHPDGWMTTHDWSDINSFSSLWCPGKPPRLVSLLLVQGRTCIPLEQEGFSQISKVCSVQTVQGWYDWKQTKMI